MKIIVDTNVFISGIFWSGPPYQILKAWQQRKLNLVVSQEILNEYHRVAKALSEKYPIIDLSPFIELLSIYTEVCSPRKLKASVSRDPDDDKFIACALTAKINIIITGNKDLLSVSGYEGLNIMKPGSFVKSYL